MQNRTTTTLKSYLDYPDLIDVIPLDNFYLQAAFSNGEVKKVDMKPYFERRVFQPLKDVELFKKARAEYGGVIWNDDIDLAQEALYDRGVTIDHNN